MRESGDGVEEELADFGGAFAVAPVADPDEVVLFRGVGKGMEDGGVGGFVEGPDVGEVEAVAVDVLEDFAEGEDAVEAIEGEEAHVFGRGGGAVVGVVEEELEAELVAQAERGAARVRADSTRGG